MRNPKNQGQKPRGRDDESVWDRIHDMLRESEIYQVIYEEILTILLSDNPATFFHNLKASSSSE